MNTVSIDPLDELVLSRGSHNNLAEGVCLLEACAWVAGEPWSDRPRCVSPVLAVLGQSLNDAFPHEPRQHLKRFIPRLLNTAGDGQDRARGFLALDWLLQVYAPAWLRLVPELEEDADRLAGLYPLATAEDAVLAAGIAQEIAGHVTAVLDATGDAGKKLVLIVNGFIPKDMLTASGRVRSSIRVGDAVRVAAGTSLSTARISLGSAAWAWDAARDAAWIAGVTRVAAGDDPWEHAAPTADTLQGSAIDLFDRMIDPAGVAA